MSIQQEMGTETGLQHQRVHPARQQDTYSLDLRSIQDTETGPGHQPDQHSYNTSKARTRGSSLSLNGAPGLWAEGGVGGG